MSVLRVTHRFSLTDYCTLRESGILQDDDRVELVQGDIIDMAPTGSRHLAAVNVLTSLFSAKLGPRAVVSVQNPIRLNDESMPQPDIALLIPRNDNYRGGVPSPADILLVVEVADSSIDYDQRIKRPLYARAGIREYWIVDLVRNRIEVYASPEAAGYVEVLRFERGQTLAPGAFPEVFLDVEEIIG